MTGKFTPSSILALIDEPLEFGEDYASKQTLLTKYSNSESQKFLSLVSDEHKSDQIAQKIMDLTFDLKKSFKVQETLEKLSSVLSSCHDFSILRNNYLIGPLILSLNMIYQKNKNNFSYSSQYYEIFSHLLKESANFSHFPHSLYHFYFDLFSFDSRFSIFFPEFSSFFFSINPEELSQNLSSLNVKAIISNLSNNAISLNLFLQLFSDIPISDETALFLLDHSQFSALVDRIPYLNDESHVFIKLSEIFNRNYSNTNNIFNFKEKNYFLACVCNALASKHNLRLDDVAAQKCWELEKSHVAAFILSFCNINYPQKNEIINSIKNWMKIETNTKLIEILKERLIKID